MTVGFSMSEEEGQLYRDALSGHAAFAVAYTHQMDYLTNRIQMLEQSESESEYQAKYFREEHEDQRKNIQRLNEENQNLRAGSSNVIKRADNLQAVVDKTANEIRRAISTIESSPETAHKYLDSALLLLADMESKRTKK